MKKQTLTSRKIINTIERHRNDLAKFDVKKIGLFGSFSKHPDKSSDIDFLVEFKKPSFDNYMGLKFKLEKLFNRKVDLVIEKELKPALKYVKKETIYAKGL